MCINNNKGYVAIIFCFIMPVIIAIPRLFIDQLRSSVKSLKSKGLLSGFFSPKK